MRRPTDWTAIVVGAAVCLVLGAVIAMALSAPAVSLVP